MIPEILHTTLELLHGYRPSSMGSGAVRPSRVIIVGAWIARVMLTIAAIVAIVCCGIIVVELGAFLPSWGWVALLALAGLVGTGALGVWRWPSMTARWLVPSGILLMPLSGVVFAALLPSKPPAPESVFAMIFLPIAALGWLVFGFAGRRDLGLFDWAQSRERSES